MIKLNKKENSERLVPLAELLYKVTKSLPHDFKEHETTNQSLEEYEPCGTVTLHYFFGN